MIKKEITGICLQNGKITKLEVDGVLVDINIIINNIKNNSYTYEVKNGEEVVIYGNDYVRSNPDLSTDNNLLKLPNKCI